MDIRSFFGKKPAKKKPALANSDAATTDTNTTTTTKTTTTKTPKEEKKKASVIKADIKIPNNNNKNKNKRKVINDDDDEEIVEISPQDYFAKSATTNKPITEATNRKITSTSNKDDEDDDDIDGVVSGSPLKKIRSSPRRSSTTATASVSAKSETVVEEKDHGGRRKNNKRRILDDDDDDDNFFSDDATDDGNDDSYVLVDNPDDDNFEEDDDDDDDDDDYESTKNPTKQLKKRISPTKSTPSKKQPPPPSSSPASSSLKTKTPSPTKAKRARKSPALASASKTKAVKIVILEPTSERNSFDVDNDIVVPECMTGLTFVFTGNMDELNRDDAIDLIKTLGGRVTTAVSGKTNYLVVGPVLEDGRDYTEGSKYRKATPDGEDSKVKLIMGEKYLYGLCHLYHDQAMKEKGIDINDIIEKKKKEATAAAAVKAATTTTITTGSTVSNPYAEKGPVSNPYSKSKGPVLSNPYAKAKGSVVSNPYAKNKGSVSNPYAKKNSTGDSSSSAAAPMLVSQNDTINSLWVDRYKPSHTREILGNKTNVKKLQDWLRTWEKVFNNSKNANKTFSNPRGGPWKAALLSGPPGIGKTTTATLVAKEDGRDVLELNASDARSKKALSSLGDLTGSQGISFINMKKSNETKKPASIQKRCVIMDEVDGMGGGDRSGISELIQMIKKSKTPIICICNDRQSQKIKSLLPYCMDLRYSRPTKNVLANRAIRIAETEGLAVERNAAEAIAESCGNDVRQVINLLQMWAQKKDDNDDGEGEGQSTALTYKRLKDRGKSMQKDEMLRVNLFDAAKLIMEGPRDLAQADDKTKLNSLFKRSDAFFVDYSFTGLIVQQNYPKIVQSQYLRVKQKGDPVEELRILERLHDAALSMSDYNLCESQIRGGDLNWSLLPTAAILAVKTGYHAGGESGGFLGGFPEFTSWMGKNSSMGKNYRLLNELSQHMNYKVSANAQELRRTYIPVMRDRIFTLLKNGDADSNKEVIAFMDEYGLSRDDIVEKLDCLVLGKKELSFDDLDSKQKAAFTRQYNSGVHKSQALVREQGGGGIKKKKGKKVVDDEDEDDVSDDDSSVDEVDDDKELEKLAAQFKKKGRKKAAAKPKKKGKGKK